MVRTKDTALQRLKVGGLGLVAVLLFVSLANMIIVRADKNETDTANMQVSQRSADPELNSQAPLLEIGVVPQVVGGQIGKSQATPKPLPPRDILLPQTQPQVQAQAQPQVQAQPQTQPQAR